MDSPGGVTSTSFTGIESIQSIAFARDVPGVCFALSADWQIHRLPLGGGEPLASTPVRPVSLAPAADAWDSKVSRPALHVSNDGTVAAVAADFSVDTIVVSLESGSVTLAHSLDVNHHPETVPASVAFFATTGKQLVALRTAWNRVDVFDAASGELVTPRHIEPYVSRGERPEHDLDYFYGELQVSPGQSRMLSDGWHWHPVGAVYAWRIEPWLGEYPWEPEDGGSRVAPPEGSDDWNLGPCWLTDVRFACCLTEDDSKERTSRIAVIDIDEVPRKPSRRARYLDHGLLIKHEASRLFGHDDMLAAVSEAGLTVWGLPETDPISTIEGFKPTAQRRADRALYEWKDGRLLTWTY